MNIGIKNIYDDRVLVSPQENEWELKVGDLAVFKEKAKEGEAIGTVIYFDKKQRDENEEKLEGEILRKANEKDLKKIQTQKEEAKLALDKGAKKVEELEIPMKILEARISFDESEVSFIFTSEERVDFKEVVPRLAGVMQKKIHLSQMGMRDRAQIVGGYGICGRKQCCSGGVLKKFHSITMEMVKTQELAMKGSEKLSGPCGKLLCCLAYELDEYKKAREKLPAWGSRVKTPRGEGKVIALDILNQKVKVYLEKSAPEFFDASEVKEVKS